MDKLILFILCLTALVGCFSAGATKLSFSKLQAVTPANSKHFDCQSAREFITTYNYLEEIEAGMEPVARRHLAREVAQGCSGAAGRFIKVTALLLRARLGTREALRIGKDYSQLGDDRAKLFGSVFKTAYKKGLLDLELQRSISLALDLSQRAGAGAVGHHQDFAELAAYCLSTAGLADSRPKCAQFAVRLAKYGQDREQKVAPAFKELIAFLRQNKSGPQLTTEDARTIAEKVIAKSSGAVRNFIQTYKFATSAKMNLDRKDAIFLAERMADATVWVQPDIKISR